MRSVAAGDRRGGGGEAVDAGGSVAGRGRRGGFCVVDIGGSGRGFVGVLIGGVAVSVAVGIVVWL